MKFKVNKGFIVQKVGDKSTIFDGESSVLFTFNKPGSVIFDKIKLGWDKEKIIKLISKTYSISEEKAQKDFEEFTAELIKSKIIKKT